CTMSHGPEHHIEHAEHAAHAAHDPFDKRVTLTITIVAVLLAAVTLLSHRAHNATLQLQADASNKWNYFQSKKNRQYLYETANTQTVILMDMPQPDAVMKSKEYAEWKKKTETAREPWTKAVKRYSHETTEIQDEAEDRT